MLASDGGEQETGSASDTNSVTGGWFLSRGRRKASEALAVEGRGRDKKREKKERPLMKADRGAVILAWRITLVRLAPPRVGGSSGLGGWRTFRITSDRQKTVRHDTKMQLPFVSPLTRSQSWTETSFSISFFFLFFSTQYRFVISVSLLLLFVGRCVICICPFVIERF